MEQWLGVECVRSIVSHVIVPLSVHSVSRYFSLLMMSIERVVGCVDVSRMHGLSWVDVHRRMVVWLLMKELLQGNLMPMGVCGVMYRTNFSFRPNPWVVSVNSDIEFRKGSVFSIVVMELILNIHVMMEI